MVMLATTALPGAWIWMYESSHTDPFDLDQFQIRERLLSYVGTFANQRPLEAL